MIVGYKFMALFKIRQTNISCIMTYVSYLMHFMRLSSEQGNRIVKS